MREIKIHLGVVPLLLLLVLFDGCVCAKAPKHNDKLILVHTICRHGARNILFPYPNDPWKSEADWPGGFGQLTDVGKQQHYQLGQYLRKRYGKLIGNDKNSGKRVYVESTDTPRTMASAKACLSGLLPTGGEQHQVHVVPRSDDFYMQFTKSCKQYDQFFIEQLTPKIKNGLFVNHASLINYLKEHSGWNMETLNDIVYLYDILDTEQMKGLQLPPWAKEIMIPGGEFEELAVNCLAINATTIESIRLTSGYLLKEILDHDTKKLKSALQPDVSLWMYFAHDVTLTYVLNSLKVFTQHRVPYASCLFFELYQRGNDPYIQVFYRNTTQQHIEPLVIPDCGSKCSLAKFQKLYAEIIPTQSFDEECAQPHGEDWTTVWNENLPNNYGV